MEFTTEGMLLLAALKVKKMKKLSSAPKHLPSDTATNDVKLQFLKNWSEKALDEVWPTYDDNLFVISEDNHTIPKCAKPRCRKRSETFQIIITILVKNTLLLFTVEFSFIHHKHEIQPITLTIPNDNQINYFQGWMTISMQCLMKRFRPDFGRSIIHLYVVCMTGAGNGHTR